MRAVLLVGLFAGCPDDGAVVDTAPGTARFDTDLPVDSPDSDPPAPLPVEAACTGNTSHTVTLDAPIDPAAPPALIGWASAGYLLQAEARGLAVGAAEVLGSYPVDAQLRPIADCLWLALPPSGDVPAWAGYPVERWTVTAP